jgi:hypothetical protein
MAILQTTICCALLCLAILQLTICGALLWLASLQLTIRSALPFDITTDYMLYRLSTMLEFFPFFLAFGSPFSCSYMDWGSNQLELRGNSTEPWKSIAPMDTNQFVFTCGSGIDLNRFVSMQLRIKAHHHHHRPTHTQRRLPFQARTVQSPQLRTYVGGRRNSRTDRIRRWS